MDEDKTGPAEGRTVASDQPNPPETILSIPSAVSAPSTRFNRIKSSQVRWAGVSTSIHKSVDRLLWRRRARPSATLDKMRTKL